MSNTYESFGKTIWRKEKPPVCQVESLRLPPEEIELRESLGRMFVKGTDPDKATAEYRRVKKLPKDWPLKVTVRVPNEPAVVVFDPPQVEPEPPKTPVGRQPKRSSPKVDPNAGAVLAAMDVPTV